MIHRSKIGLEIILPTAVILTAVLITMLVNGVWLGLIVTLMVCGLIINICTNTYYKIHENGVLEIRCGILEHFEIDINSIEWVKPSRDLGNAPALSLDRLQLKHRGGSVLVSPRNKARFLADLRRFNTRI